MGLKSKALSSQKFRSAHPCSYSSAFSDNFSGACDRPVFCKFEESFVKVNFECVFFENNNPIATNNPWFKKHTTKKICILTETEFFGLFCKKPDLKVEKKTKKMFFFNVSLRWSSSLQLFLTEKQLDCLYFGFFQVFSVWCFY